MRLRLLGFRQAQRPGQAAQTRGVRSPSLAAFEGGKGGHADASALGQRLLTQPCALT